MAWDRKPFKIKLPTCNHCGAVGKHYAWQCPSRSKQPLRKESIKSRSKRLEVRELWFELNPPDKHGMWTCYLQISPDCPKRLSEGMVNLEHVKPRSKNPELKYDVSNIKAACLRCNGAKGSRSIAGLARQFPHLEKYL